jgi:hypothetical protein
MYNKFDEINQRLYTVQDRCDIVSIVSNSSLRAAVGRRLTAGRRWMLEVRLADGFNYLYLLSLLQSYLMQIHAGGWS